MINDYNSVCDIYDLYNTASYDIDFYLKRFKNFKGNAVELMAGTGRLSIPLIKSGMKLDCVDISKGLLDRLSEKLSEENLQGNIYCQDIRFLNLEKKYDLIIIAFNSFSEIIDVKDRELVFRSVKNIISEPGEFIFTLYNPSYRRKSISNNLTFVDEFPVNDNKLRFFISSAESDSIVEVKQFYELYDDSGILLNKRMLNLKFKLINRNEIEELIRRSGFIIKEFYGNFDSSEYDENISPFMIYILRTG